MSEQFIRADYHWPGFCVVIAISLWIPCGAKYAHGQLHGSAKDVPGKPYSSIHANEFVELMFPITVLPEDVSRSLVNSQITREWTSLDDTYTHHDAVQRPDVTSPKMITFAAAPIDSYWLSSLDSDTMANEFFTDARLGRLEQLISRMRQQSILTQVIEEKALLQRDVLQLFTILSQAIARVHNGVIQSRASKVLSLTGQLLADMRFTEDEIIKLKISVNRRRNISRFSQGHPPTLDEDYLPLRAVDDDDSWSSLAFRVKYNQHYTKYRGRSFVHVYGRSPEMTSEQFQRFRTNIARAAGAEIHTVKGLPSLAVGTETMLIRTAGVLLYDGSIVDSGITEEVIIRYFSTEVPEFTPESSDFRGTMHYQYVLDRERYLCDPQEVGLVRILDDEPAYIGLIPRSPDIATSWNRYMGTSRFNCINCHSEAVHGVATIFSFGYEGVATSRELFRDSTIAVFDESASRIKLISPEYLALQEFFSEADTVPSR